MKKKIISIMLALMMSAGTAIVPAAAAEIAETEEIGAPIQSDEVGAAADSEAVAAEADFDAVAAEADSDEVAAEADSDAVSAVTPGAVQLKNGTESFNFSAQNYTRWSDTVKSYLTQKSDGTLERVEFCPDTKKIIYEVYSSDGKTKKSSGTVNMELDTFGGFYSGSTYNFLVFGKSNSSHSNSNEVIRFVKYSKDWKRQSAASVKGANTAIPFDAGSLRMAENNGKLYVHTCHKMYNGHQANMTYSITESNMTVAESYYDVGGYDWKGYASHSFNQFIKEDGTYLYRVDHGDAYPRAIGITKAKLSGSFTSVTTALPVSLSNTGSIGANDTGASVGGFELSSNKCIIAFNAVDFTKSNADPNGKRNIYLSITGKDLKSTKNVRITSYGSSSKINVSTPQLVKLDNTNFLLLWEEFEAGKNTALTKICKVNENGTIDSQGIVSTNYLLSDCQPILCKDGGVKWYTSIANTPTLYTVNPSALSKSASTAAQSLDKEISVTLEIGEKYNIPASVLSRCSGMGCSGSSGFFECNEGYKVVNAKKCCTGSLSYSMNYGGTITYKFTIIEPRPKPGAVTVTLSNVGSTLKASWNSVNLAKSFIVYYRLSTQSSWSQFSTSLTNATIPGVKPGYAYCVQVQTIGDEGVKGAYSSVKTLTYIPQVRPTLTLSNKSNGIRAEWNALSGATQYIVSYKKTEDSSWTTAKTTNNYYPILDITPDVNYSVKVQPVYNSSNGLASTVSSLTYIPQVKTTVTLSNKSNGIRADWTAVTGATKYIIYYRESSASTWSNKETKYLYHLFTGIEAGTSYSFQVQPVFGSSKGMYSSVVSLTYVPQVKPTLTVANKSNGIRAEWTAVTGATKYIVYYKETSASSWSNKETTNNYYLFSGLKAGTNYCFQVQPVFVSSKGLYSTVSQLTYVPQVKPEVTLSNKTNGIRAEWKAVTGATKYIVYFKESSASSWTSKETTNLYYALTGINIGATYYVQVKPVFGNVNGLYSKVSSLVYVPQVKPAVTLTNKSNGIRAEWKEITGATKYVVYYRETSSSTWTSKETTNLYYALTGIKAGTSYSFQVQPVFGQLKGAYSSVYKLTYVPQVKPTLTLANQSNGIKASWKAVSGATKYIVYYKKAGASSWTSVQTSNCYYTYLNAVKGTSYTFKVQPVFVESKGFYSAESSITFK